MSARNANLRKHYRIWPWLLGLAIFAITVFTVARLIDPPTRIHYETESVGDQD